MCRLLGIVSSEAVDFRLCLREAPRSVAVLSREHRDGWGIAVFDGQGRWTLQKAPCCAHEDKRFHEVALGSRGVLLIAHVRKRTVGVCRIENTHPFEYGRWVFAHNGTIAASEWLSAQTPASLRMAVRGDTDSERLFAFLLSHIERSSNSRNAARDSTPPDSTTARRQSVDACLVEAVERLEAQPGMDSCTFVLSDGDALYAYRSGRTLFALERRPGDAVRTRRSSNETGAVLETPWSPARSALLIASEQITDEPWQELRERSLLRVDRVPVPTVTLLHGPSESISRAAG